MYKTFNIKRQKIILKNHIIASQFYFTQDFSLVLVIKTYLLLETNKKKKGEELQL